MNAQAEIARLKRRIAEAGPDRYEVTALTCPAQLRRPIPLTDTPKD